jgi:integrase
VDLKAGRAKGPLAWMVVDLALSTGLRVSEMVILKIKDIDLKRGVLSVIRLKRKKKAKETLALSKELVWHLRQFIEWKKISEQATTPSSRSGRGYPRCSRVLR